jgi:hypothetical protein
MAALAVLLAISSALAYPRPAAIAPRWELEFEAGDLRLYVDPDGGGTYWYFTYKVTNRTGRDQVWAPTFALFTDAGEILPSGRSVPARVAADLKALLGNQFLEHQNEIIGEIFHGRDHAKEGLIVWPARQVGVNEVSMFIAGTSGETATVVNPITGERVLLRKTLQRDYLIPGDAVARGSKPVEMKSQRWVMR